MHYGPKNLTISYDGKNLTHFGGVFLLTRFFKKIRLRYLISRSLRIIQRNNIYTISEETLSLIYPIILGMGRIKTSNLLRHNGVFQYLTGLPAFPNPTTLRRFLVRIVPLALPKLRKLHDEFLMRMMKKPRSPSTVIFDMDSTVLTLYGKQEKANKGYNPVKRGRPSYHPLLCFNGLTKDFWHGELRSGDQHTASGTVELLQHSFAKVPTSVKYEFVRADKGFYDHAIIEFIESVKARFAIVAKLTKPLKAKLSGLSYKKYSSGLQTAEFLYQPTKWNKKYRFIVIRRPLQEESSDQLTLFPLGNFNYQVIVTNLSLTPLNVWKFYNQRAAVELIIKELKENYPLAKIPTKHFAANEAYFHLLLFSYNLMNWFKRLCLPREFQNITLATLRYSLLLIPGELTKTHNRPLLKLPSALVYKGVFQYAILMQSIRYPFKSVFTQVSG